MPKYQTSLPKVASPLSNGKQLKNDTGKIITFLSDLPENRIPGRTDSSLAIVCKLLRILRIFFADRSSSLKTMGPSASFRCPPSCFFSHTVPHFDRWLSCHDSVYFPRNFKHTPAYFQNITKFAQIFHLDGSFMFLFF